VMITLNPSALALTTVAVMGVVGTTAFAAADAPCLIERIDLPDDCPAASCQFTHVAAVESNSVRHIVWWQQPEASTVRTAMQMHGGAVVLGTIELDPPAPTGTIHGLAARGDLLAIGVVGRVDLYRLVEQTWLFEATLTAPIADFTGRRISIAGGSDGGGGGGSGDERIVVSSYRVLPFTSGVNPRPVAVFRRDVGWELEAVLDVPPLSTLFGADVAIAGGTIAISAPTVGGWQSGGGQEVHIYDLVDGAWLPTQVMNGFAWSLAGTGFNLALVGDTLIGQNLSNSPGPAHLQIFHRGPDGFAPTDIVWGSISRPLGWDLDALALPNPDGDGVRVFASVYREANNAVIDGLMMIDIVDGHAVSETSLPLPPALPTQEGFVSGIWGVAAVGGDSPWVAATAPKDPAGTSVSIITIGNSGCDPDGGTPNDAMLGDLDGDGVVDGADLGALLAQWGTCDGCSGDLNGDGVVDGADLGILLANWTVARWKLYDSRTCRAPVVAAA